MPATMRSKTRLVYQGLGEWTRDHSFTCREDFVNQIGYEAAMAALLKAFETSEIESIKQYHRARLNNALPEYWHNVLRALLLTHYEKLEHASFVLPLPLSLKGESKITAAKKLGHSLKDRYPNATFHIKRTSDDFVGDAIYEHEISGNGKAAWEAVYFAWWHLLGIRLLSLQPEMIGECWPRTIGEVIEQSNEMSKDCWYYSTDKRQHFNLWRSGRTVESHPRYWLAGGGGPISQMNFETITESNYSPGTLRYSERKMYDTIEQFIFGVTK